MAKSKGVRRGVQVSRETVAKARYAKRHGLLSKSAKISGQKLSRAVLRKVEHLENLAAVPTFAPNAATGKLNIAKPAKNIPIKVSRARAADYRDKGFEVIRGQVIAPKGDARFIEAGRAPIGSPRAGVKTMPGHGPDPVPQGYVEVIELQTGGIRNFRDLFRALRGGKLNGVRKRPDEVYAFTFYGFHPLRGWTFATDAELLKYLERYKAITQEAKEGTEDGEESAFDNFELVRMQRGETLGRTPAEVYKRNRASRNSRTADEKRRDAIRTRSQRTQKISKEQRDAQRHEREKIASAKYRTRQRDKYGDLGWRAKQAEDRAERREKERQS